MKKVLRFLTLAAMLCIPWVTQAQGTTQTFDFEDGLIPAGWTNDATYPWIVTNAAANSGTNSIKSGNAGVNSSTSSITATFTFAGDGSISFAARCSSEQSNPSYDWDYGTFYIDGVQQGDRIINSNSFSSYNYNVEAGTHTFMWKYKKDGSVGSNDDCLYIDDVVVDLGVAPSCPKPTGMAASNVTATGATLTWTKGGSETAWVLEYGTASDFTGATSVSLGFTDNGDGTVTANLTGLTASTTYYVQVKADCGGGDESDWSTTYSFTTECDAASIPYAFGFEDAAPFACWHVISGNITRISGTAHTDSYRLDFRGTTSNMVALPIFADATNTLRLEFWTRPESNYGSSGKFAVGYMTDVNDASTFVAIATYNSTEMTTSYVQKTVDFAGAPAGARIAMRQFDCSTNYYWYVDDVNVIEMPSCVAPTALDADNITINSAELSWTPNSGESEWTLYYKKTGDGSYTEVADVTDNPYTLSGLDAASTYQFYVKANCGGGEESEASDVFQFTTACDVYAALNFEEDFDALTAGNNVLPLCWNYINTTTYSYYQGYPRAYNYSAYSGTNCLYFYSYYGVSYDPQPQYAILPEMTGLSNKQVTLWAKGGGTTPTFKIGTMTDPTDASTFTPIAEQALTTSYAEYVFYVLNDNTDNYLAIKMDAATSSRTSISVYIDDISIVETPTCFQPCDLTHTDVAARTATVVWDRHVMGTENAWDLQLATNSTFTEGVQNIVVNTTPSKALTGLTPETHYYVRVKPACDDAGLLWSDPDDFTTLASCLVPTALTVDDYTNHTANLSWTGSSANYNIDYRTKAYMNGITEGFGTSIPSGWIARTGAFDEGAGTATLTGSSSWSFGTSNSVFDQHAYFNMYGTKNYWLITPSVTIDAGSVLGFDVAYTGYYGGAAVSDAPHKLYVLISTDDMATWNVLRKWDNDESSYVLDDISQTGQSESIDLSAYDGETAYIAFLGVSSTTSYDNNIHIDNVVIGTPVPAGEWQHLATNINEVELDGLTPSTPYEVKVQGDCGIVDGTSDWTALVSFTTDIPCPAPTLLPYSELKSRQVTLTWTENGTTDAWVVAYKLDADDDFTEVPATTNPFILDNLDPEKHYTVKVKANCEASSDGTSEFSNTVDFTTLEACSQPSDLDATIITNTTATIRWTGDSEFILWYREAATVDGVEEDFTAASMPPANWTKRTGLVDAAVAGTDPTSTNDGWRLTMYAFGSNNATLNIYGSSCKYWLVTPEITLDAGAVLNFDLALTDFGNNDPIEDNTAQADDRFAVVIYSDDAWTILREWNNGESPYVYNNIATAGENVNIALSAYVGKTVKIAFYGESTAPGGDNDLHIDNVAIGTPIPAGGLTSVDAGTATTQEIALLTPETKYEVYVEAVCGDPDPHPVSESFFFTTKAGITKDIAADQWYAISSPVHDYNMADESFANVTNLTSGTYDLLFWDQANGTWKTSKPTVIEEFARGTGYIYRRSTDATLTFVGHRTSGDFSTNTLYSTCDDANLKGFNLLGNPYPKAYAPTVDHYTLQDNGMWLFRLASPSNMVAVGEAFFIKKDANGTYAFVEPSGAKSAPRSNAGTIALTVSNDEYSDIAYARFADGENMPKMRHLNPSAPMLSIPQDDRQFAIVTLDENTERFPLHFNGYGDFAFSLSDNSLGLGYIHLIDRETGADIDMLRQSSYTFSANGSNNDRFEVLLKPVAADSFVRVSDSRLIVDGEGELQVFDVMGRQLGSAQVSGTTTLDRSELGIVSAGVYVLRLGGNSQKIVVK